MSILGAIGDLLGLTATPRTAHPPAAHDGTKRQGQGGGGGSPSGAGKTPTLAGLAMAAEAAGALVAERADWLWQQSQQRGGQYLSQHGPLIASTALGILAKKIPVPQGASYGAIVNRAVQFDQDYNAMLNGQGWAAYPNSGQTDNMEGLQEIAAGLQAAAAMIAAMARKAAQQSQGRPPRVMSPSGMQALAHLSAGSPKLQRQARKVIVGAMIESYGPHRTYEMLGEACLRSRAENHL